MNIAGCGNELAGISENLKFGTDKNSFSPLFSRGKKSIFFHAPGFAFGTDGLFKNCFSAS